MGDPGAGSRVLEIGCAIGKLPWRWPSAAWTWRRSIPPRAWWKYWVTPDASWSKTARLLRPGGLLALIWYVGGSMELDTEMLAA
jgi:hypothetical protein